MHTQILFTSKYTFDFLAGQPAGQVHSVYRKTVNILLDGHLFALQTCQSPLSPLSMITNISQNEMDSMEITAGNPVSVRGKTIWVRKSSFSLSASSIVDLRLKAQLNDQELKLLSERIKAALFLVPKIGFAAMLQSSPNNSPKDLILSAAFKHISAAREFCRLGNWKSAAIELSSLIGLGSGLTPSGDDFLCGLIAGLSLSRCTTHPLFLAVTKTLSPRLSDTNDISRAFLLCALKGQFSLAVQSLTKLPAAAELLMPFLSIGHSSGIDTLCGIYWGLQLQQITKKFKN